jgi:ABC-type uncharacterized transport system permease subunit
MTITINLFATLAWLATWLLIGVRLRDRLQKRRPPYRHLLVFAWLMALGLHGWTIIHAITQLPGIAINFTAAGSIVMWLSSFLLFATMLARPLETLGIFVIPFTLTAMLLPLLEPSNTNTINLNDGLGAHILTSLLAYSMFTLASLQALLLAWQNKHLHNHNPGGLIRTLPPLLDMEALLFKLIALGLILLSFGLLSGTLYVDNLFSQHLAHKTILSIIAWLAFSTLLFGHWKYGWRGRMAIRWTLGGFFILMLAFFGSKFVLEFILRPAA